MNEILRSNASNWEGRGKVYRKSNAVIFLTESEEDNNSTLDQWTTWRPFPTSTPSHRLVAKHSTLLVEGKR